MRVRTKPFGEIEVNDRQVLQFPRGIYGFDELTSYVLLDASQQPFYWLQSLERPTLAFVLLDPRVFLPGYRLDVPEEELGDLGSPAAADRLDLAIVTIPADPNDMTANLQGPLVVNKRTRIGRQCISRNPDHSVRQRVMDALAARER